MLLQLPVFLGLYNALMQAIELRHAPFVGWIHDLSQPDRLGAWPIPFVSPPGIPVLTLLMGVSMVVQQKMTPSSADPVQQRMMMILPVVFTVMFINFPAGLVLYWLSNNVLSIAQQHFMTRSKS
jgi:YidC/Oxa1 family membrane protein insertase